MRKLLRQKTHKTIKKVTEDIERFHFNTAISAVMELVNEIYVSEVKDRDDEISKRVMREAIETIVVLLSPFVPSLRGGALGGLWGTRSPSFRGPGRIMTRRRSWKMKS